MVSFVIFMRDSFQNIICFLISIIFLDMHVHFDFRPEVNDTRLSTIFDFSKCAYTLLVTKASILHFYVFILSS